MMKRQRIPRRNMTQRLKQPDRKEMDMFRHQQNLLGGLGQYPAPLRPHDIPGDLRKRIVQEYGADGRPRVAGEDTRLDDILEGVEQIAATQVLSRGLLGRNYTITTAQTSVARAEKLRGYYFLNPTASVGLTTTVTAVDPMTVVAAGNTQSTPIGVATFREVHCFIDITDTDGATTTLTLNLDAFDPESENWATAQQIISTAVVGTYYVNVGSIGIATDMSFSWTVSGGSPTATFSLSCVLKDGLAGSSTSGLANVIYLGPNGVTTTTGFPLLEGQQQAFYLRENLELFAISEVSGLSLRVFEL